MKAFLECVSCIIRQTIEILRRIEKNEQKQRKVLAAVVKKLSKMDLNRMTPPEATKFAHDEIQRITGIIDLYKEPKRQNNREALRLYPYLKRLVKRASDPLFMAIRLAIAGNIIDYGALAEFDIKHTVKDVLGKKFAASDYKRFKRDLKKAKLLLYIGDNAGEIVFDKVLVEELVKRTEVVFVVKSKPVLNDVLMADAKMVGLDKVVKVIPSGSDHAGTTVSAGSSEFKKLYKKADMVIAKGQGNFETLDQEKKNIYFLLKMKCPYLGEVSGFKEGDIILKSLR
ncbi:MAG: ARMT1-like domain-containing protein [Candidatus Margulisiibacteriota bacterium]